MANTWMEGTYSDLYRDVSQDEARMCRLFRQFSFPGGIPSHAAPQTPGSIHEGGELGYSLSHAYSAVLDNPNLIAACVIGDGEAETGPLATSWHSNKFLNAVPTTSTCMCGYKEEGSTTTPFDMVVRNDLDRFHLIADVVERVPALSARAGDVKQRVRDKIVEHKRYIAARGIDMPEVRNWCWSEQNRVSSNEA